MGDVIDAHRLFAAHPAPGGTVVALQSLSLTVEAGERLVLVGPSGSGKSTLLRCLAGRLRPLSGELTVFGTPLHEVSGRELAAYRAHTVALVQQRYTRGLSPDLPAWKIVALRPALLGWPLRRRRARAFELLERVGLEQRGRARRIELSGGEQQRVALCVALSVQPRLLLADEVTGELDDASGAQVLAALRELAEAAHTTVVLATHDRKATEVADRTVTIRDGRVTGELIRGPLDRRLVTIDDGGVLRIDPADLAVAGIQREARLDVTAGAVVLQRHGAGAREPAQPPATPARTPASRASAPTAEARNVVRRFSGRERPALDGVSLDLLPGMLHVLSGPSGCGKTTLIHILAGLDRADAGTIEVLGRDLRLMARGELAEWRRRNVAIVPQSTALVGFLSALENVELGLTVRGIPALEARPRGEAALALVGLHDVAHRPTEDLSAGQRQRVGVARALAARPALLLADEPTANLDERNAVMVAERLATTAHEEGIAILCATHDPSVTAHADRVTSLRSGRLAGAEDTVPYLPTRQH